MLDVIKHVHKRSSSIDMSAYNFCRHNCASCDHLDRELSRGEINRALYSSVSNQYAKDGLGNYTQDIG